ncbi:MAG: ribonuclease J [Holosporaceae bacterium]|jgi:ribonuclease J|nr:ribonuclease J [Holosporaceae bacterium]
MKKKSEKKLERDGLNFISVGGCSEIGMNLYAYVLDDQWILVDMGLGFDNALGRELLVPSPEILIKNKSKIKALFITHSHEDHIGAIPYIWSMVECPIYGRPFAIEMMRDKVKQFSLGNDIPFIKVSVGAQISAGNFVVEYIPVAHSTPESSALAIKTPKGIVIHTGDWRLDDEPVLGSKTDEKRLKEYGDSGVTALVCDSTNVFRDEKFGSEKEVRKNLIQVVKKHKKNRVLITCFASNLARLESCYMAAKESGRQMVVAGRSLKKIEKIAKLSGYLTTLPAFLDEKRANSLNPANLLLVCTGSQGEHNSALAKIAHGTHQNIKLQEGDVVIFSSRVIPGNEKSVLEIQNALTEKGVKIIMDTDYEIHASGHPSKEELVHLYDLVQPQVLVPIHGESIQLHRHAEIGREYGIKNVIVPYDGCVINLSQQTPQIVDKVPAGILAVDGNKLIPIDGMVYKQRETLSSCGAVSACVRHNKGTVKLIDMQYFGIFENSEQTEIQDIKNDIASEIKLSLENISRGNADEKNIKASVERIIRVAFMDARGKKPVVFVHVIGF